MLHNVINHYILICGSICGAVQLVYKFFAVQCGMRTELSGAVQFADKNFTHRTISNAKVTHGAFFSLTFGLNTTFCQCIVASCIV